MHRTFINCLFMMTVWGTEFLDFNMTVEMGTNDTLLVSMNI